MRIRTTIIATMIATMTQALGVIDVHSHIITPEFVLHDDTMLVRIAEIEVYPEHLEAYLAAATEIQQKSLAEEPGVLCLFPNQMKSDSTQFRILEIYTSQQAYQHHIQTAHFQKYKQGTLHMVKSLKLQDLTPLNRETMSKIFKRLK